MTDDTARVEEAKSFNGYVLVEHMLHSLVGGVGSLTWMANRLF